MEMLRNQIETEDGAKDLLDRQVFVDRVINIIEKLSANKKNASYAINGKWGVGKTFVLEMIEKKIKKIQQSGSITNKYFLFHYDCWKYDFYEEPTIAIVAYMMDEIDKSVELLSENTRNKLKAMLKAVGSVLLSNMKDIIKEKTKINIDEIEKIINGTEKAVKEAEKNHEYDTYFAFKDVLSCLQKTIAMLSEEQTIIFVVDELDRCLPEYMVKVLERLHHIFGDVSNVQVLLSIDKEQIKHTVEQIYGIGTDVDKYLAKFIDFDINLDVGDLNEEFKNSYAYYFKKFECQNEATNIVDIEEFRRKILGGMDMRSKIEIVNKCDLLHDILCTQEKADYSIMCIEMFFAVLKYWDVDMTMPTKSAELKIQFNYEKKEDIDTGLDYLQSVFSRTESGGLKLVIKDGAHTYVRRENIWTVLVAGYRYVLGFINDHIEYDKYKGQGLRTYSEEFWELLNIIN